MTKMFCDMCGCEITEDNRLKEGQNGNRMAAKLKRGSCELTVEVMTSYHNVANKGDFCKHCVLDALYRLDDRPKEATS